MASLKRIGVTITRTITLEQTVYIRAKNVFDAMERVKEKTQGIDVGDPYVTFKGAKGIFKDAEGGEINEEIQVDDAFEDEEE